MNIKRLFRFHRGGLAESLGTTIEVSGLADIQLAAHDELMGYCSNVRIKPEPIEDRRLPEDWNGIEYYVIADMMGYKDQCIGMSNFYEKQ